MPAAPSHAQSETEPASSNISASSSPPTSDRHRDRHCLYNKRAVTKHMQLTAGDRGLPASSSQQAGRDTVSPARASPLPDALLPRRFAPPVEGIPPAESFSEERRRPPLSAPNGYATPSQRTACFAEAEAQAQRQSSQEAAAREVFTGIFQCRVDEPLTHD